MYESLLINGFIKDFFHWIITNGILIAIFAAIWFNKPSENQEDSDES